MQPKYHINNTNFPQGFNTTDDAGRTAGARDRTTSWDGAGHCRAAATAPSRWDTELENSAAFASCQVTRVFKDVCLRAPNSNADFTQVNSMISSFQSHNYSLRQVFAEGAAYCMGT